MSSHNIYFYGEIRKILCGYSILSGTMTQVMGVFLIFQWQNILRVIIK